MKPGSLIEAELESRTGSEIAAAYQLLCGAMLAETCKTLARRYIRRKDQVLDKRVAREWLAGRESVIPYNEMCQALGIDARRTKSAIESYAERPVGHPISRTVLGVLSNVDQ